MKITLTTIYQERMMRQQASISESTLSLIYMIEYSISE